MQGRGFGMTSKWQRMWQEGASLLWTQLAWRGLWLCGCHFTGKTTLSGHVTECSLFAVKEVAINLEYVLYIPRNVESAPQLIYWHGFSHPQVLALAFSLFFLLPFFFFPFPFFCSLCFQFFSCKNICRSRNVLEQIIRRSTILQRWRLNAKPSGYPD